MLNYVGFLLLLEWILNSEEKYISISYYFYFLSLNQEEKLRDWGGVKHSFSKSIKYTTNNLIPWVKYKEYYKER